MADPITWYALPRTVDDIETIKEAVDAKILAHNIDPSAHGQPAESVYEHRTEEDLDHVSYSIYNIKMAPQTRAIKAFVGQAGVGDFADVQQAIDYVSLHGGGKVLVKQGEYTLADHITHKDDVILEGEGPELTILNFNGNSKNLRILGDTEFEDGITWGLPHGSKIITGVGTSFLSKASPGDYWPLNSVYYEIDTVDSDLQITLKTTYQGVSFVGETEYTIVDPVKNAVVRNLTVKGAGGADSLTGSGIYGQYGKDCLVEDVFTTENNYHGLDLGLGQNNILRNVRSFGNVRSGFYLFYPYASGGSDLLAFSNGNHGFYIQCNASAALSLSRIEAYHNDNHGVYIYASAGASLVQIHANFNSVDGIQISSASRNILMNIQAHDNGNDGLNIVSSGSYRNVIVGASLLNNGNDAYEDAGTDTDLSHIVVD